MCMHAYMVSPPWPRQGQGVDEQTRRMGSVARAAPSHWGPPPAFGPLGVRGPAGPVGGPRTKPWVDTGRGSFRRQCEDYRSRSLLCQGSPLHPVWTRCSSAGVEGHRFSETLGEGVASASPRRGGTEIKFFPPPSPDTSKVGQFAERH